MNEHRTEAPAGPLGTRIGGFLLQEKLGAGGMAEVFLAARAGAQRTEFAALKRLLPHLTFDAEFVRMFLAEVKLTAQLDHPGIARVLEYGTGEGGHFLAMEYVHGHDVRAVLRAVADVGADLGFVLGVVADLADALHYAHEFRSTDGSVQGLIHRDVSPSNVRIATDGTVKLLDFGIAHAAGHTRVTKAGTLKGKVGYMSPEQCRAETVDRRTDIFALGVLLYELSTGRRAFYGNSDLETLAMIIQGRYASPQSVRPEIPTEIAALTMRMLSDRPNKRPATAAEVAHAIRDYATRRNLPTDAAARAGYLQSLFGNTGAPQLPPSAPTLHATPPRTQVAPAPEIPAALEAAEVRPQPRTPLLLIGVAILSVGGIGYLVGRQASEPVPSGVTSREPKPSTQPSTPPPAEAEPGPVPAIQDPPAPPVPPPEPTAPDPSPEPEVVIEVADDAPAPRRRRGPKAAKPEPTAEPDRPAIDAASLLAPSLRQ